MTFVLGLTGEKIASQVPAEVALHDRRRTAVAQGAKLLNRYNCTGCHVLEMPKYTIAAGTTLEDAFTDFDTNVKVSYSNRANDYLKEFYPGLTLRPQEAARAEAATTAKAVTIEGMPIGVFEDDAHRPALEAGDDPRVTPSTSATTSRSTRRRSRRPRPRGATSPGSTRRYQAEKTGSDFATFWNRLPPPLLREGKKVQTPWLTAFLNDPYADPTRGQPADAQVPLRQVGCAGHRRNGRPGQLLRRA